MKRTVKTIFIFFAGTAVATAAVPDDVYPPGSGHVVRYELSSDTVNAGEPFTIVRDFINNEATPVEGLYFSEHLPPAGFFEIVSHQVTVNGQAVQYFYEWEPDYPVINDYESYYWVLDEPAMPDISHTIYPGDSVRLEINLVAHQPGEYLLPLHTGAFVSGGNGYFATASAGLMQVLSACGDVTGDGTINLLDMTFLIDYLYLEGPSPEPLEIGDVDGNGEINILDLSALVEFLYYQGPAPDCS